MLAPSIKCPKKEEGVKCFDCSDVKTCPQMNPPKIMRFSFPKRTSIPQFQEFTPLPTDSMEKHIYRMLLLMAEDFQLISPEKHELIYFASRFKPFSPKGGRGKSKERLFACLCLYILERDGRRRIYEASKEYFDERYQLYRPDTEALKIFVKDELIRLGVKM